MGETQGGNKVHLRNLVRGTFVHHHVLGVPDVDQIEIREGLLLVGGIDDKFALYPANAGRSEWAGPRNIGNHQSCGGS